jgi:hypothetical protein
MFPDIRGIFGKYPRSAILAEYSLSCAATIASRKDMNCATLRLLRQLTFDPLQSKKYQQDWQKK